MNQLPIKTAYKIFASILLAIFVSFLFCIIQVRIEEQEMQDKFDTMWYDTTHYSLAGVSVQDSIQFEIDASLATVIDMPEELPIDGDTMCARVSNDTIYIEHYHEQDGMFIYIHNN